MCFAGSDPALDSTHIAVIAAVAHRRGFAAPVAGRGRAVVRAAGSAVGFDCSGVADFAAARIDFVVRSAAAAAAAAVQTDFVADRIDSVVAVGLVVMGVADSALVAGRQIDSFAVAQTDSAVVGVTAAAQSNSALAAEDRIDQGVPVD